MPIFISNESKNSELNQNLKDSLTGTYYLANDPEHYEIQRNNNFVFYVAGLKNKITEFYNKNPENVTIPNNFARENAEDVLKISVSSSSVPHFKQGVISLRRGNSVMKFAAKEFAARKIRVNSICPGMVDTPLIHRGTISAEQLLEDQKRYPLGRYGKPEDIAYAAIYLLSDAASWVTGQDFVLDGGVSIK